MKHSYDWWLGFQARACVKFGSFSLHYILANSTTQPPYNMAQNSSIPKIQI